jgi:hypothetical protein
MDFTIEILPAAPNFDFSVGVGVSSFSIDVYAGGVKGDPGSQGPQGSAATINVGTVVTGAASSSVVVANSGTTSSAVFDFTIPQGVQGIQGPQGEASIPTVMITETPTGLVNGVNANFTLSNTPISVSAIFFMVNGIRRTITLSGNICTLDFSPSIGSIVVVTYFKHIDVLSISVVDIVDLGTVATHNYEEFETRQLSPVFTTSTSTITSNCLNRIQYDTNVGSTDATIAFINLPTVSVENLLIINSTQTGAFTVTLPTDFVSGGINYSIKKMVQNPYIEVGGSAELNFLFIFTDSTHCEIRITGGTNV